MYPVPTPPPAVVISAGAGTLAITGINALALSVVASALIVLGALLLRIAVLASSDHRSLAAA
jgi:hypothetical protein